MVSVIRHLQHVHPEGTEALRGIHLVVEPGEHLVLEGPNGAGTSTLVLHLNGILEARSGRSWRTAGRRSW